MLYNHVNVLVVAYGAGLAVLYQYDNHINLFWRLVSLYSRSACGPFSMLCRSVCCVMCKALSKLRALVQPWKFLGNSFKDYLDSSVRGGKAYGGGDRSNRGGSRFYDDSSSKSGRSFYGDSSSHAGKVYEPIPEYTGRPSQDIYDLPPPRKSGSRAVDHDTAISSPTANGGVSLNEKLRQMQNASGAASEDRPNSKRVHKLTPLT